MLTVVLRPYPAYIIAVSEDLGKIKLGKELPIPQIDLINGNWDLSLSRGPWVMDKLYSGWGWWSWTWVGLTDLNVPTCFPAAQTIQPNSHLPKHNQAGS